MLSVLGALLLFGQVVPAIIGVYWLSGFMSRRYIFWCLVWAFFFFSTVLFLLAFYLYGLLGFVWRLSLSSWFV